MIDYSPAERPIDPGGALDSAGQLLAPSKSRPTWAEINLDNLVHNLQVMKDLVGPGVAIMSAVKADAYGHGALQCARALEIAGVDWFGVALPEEGERLREAGITLPILCLGGFWEGQEQLVISRSLTPTASRIDDLINLDRVAYQAGVVADYHLKVDTGMGRLGVPLQDLSPFLDSAGELRNLRLDGVMTHLASADVTEMADYTRTQLRLFSDAVSAVTRRGHKPTWVHAANSAAALAFPESRGNLVRLGGALYGVWRDTADPAFAGTDLRPVMSVRSTIMLLKTYAPGARIGYGSTFTTKRESVIATVPIGYSDGLPRSLSNCGFVLVKGRQADIVGRVSMDLANLDVTDIPGVSVGDEVVIIGSQGPRTITAEDIASRGGSISYEITCGISDRVPRVYVSSR
jgi:alanine racemase